MQEHRSPNGQNSAALQQVSEDDRKALQTMPPLTMVTASTATVFRYIERAATVRYNRKTAADVGLRDGRTVHEILG